MRHRTQKCQKFKKLIKRRKKLMTEEVHPRKRSRNLKRKKSHLFQEHHSKKMTEAVAPS
jgi:hypothetical protein